MADLTDYASEKLMAANERELRDLLKRYKEEHLPLWKFGLFIAYNGAALAGMYFYGVKLRGKRMEPSLLNREKYTIANLFSRGVQHSVRDGLGSW